MTTTPPPRNGRDRPRQLPNVLHSRYRLRETIGEGGMAVVWSAEDLELGRTVAIKILRPQYATEIDAVDRFKREAQAAAALNHPGILAVYDVGEEAGHPFIVMEYVEGPDLQQLINEVAPLDMELATHLAQAIAEAVSAAHGEGLVHRDIKPRNVLITSEGSVKVADFGIARTRDGVRTTAPGIVLGTLPYVAPELLEGEDASAASDVYSLGIVLYEMLTGRLPFGEASQAATVNGILNARVEPVEHLNPQVPPILSVIVGCAIDRNPQDRYASASELAEAISSYVNEAQQATAFHSTHSDRASALLAVSAPLGAKVATGRLNAAQTRMPQRAAPPRESPRAGLRRGGGLRHPPNMQEKVIASESPASYNAASPLGEQASTRTATGPGGLADARRGRRVSKLVSTVILGAITLLVTAGVAWSVVGLITGAVAGALVQSARIDSTATEQPQNTRQPAASPTDTNEDEEPTDEPTQTVAPSPTPRPARAIRDFAACLRPCDGTNATRVFPEGITRVHLQWKYDGVRVGARYVRTWTMDGREWVRYDCAWDGPASGVDTITLAEPDGLHSGTWQVTVQVDGELLLRESIHVSGNWTYWRAPGVLNFCHGLTPNQPAASAYWW